MYIHHYILILKLAATPNATINESTSRQDAASRETASHAHQHCIGKEPGMINAKLVMKEASSLNVHDATSFGTQAACTQHPFPPSDERTPSYAANSAGTN
jgi:hypothetical protein